MKHQNTLAEMTLTAKTSPIFSSQHRFAETASVILNTYAGINLRVDALKLEQAPLGISHWAKHMKSNRGGGNRLCPTFA